MSDAFTDMARDEKLCTLAEEIAALERDFKNRPALGTALTLVAKLEKYMKMPSGFWYQPDTETAEEKLAHYKQYLEVLRAAEAQC